MKFPTSFFHVVNLDWPFLRAQKFGVLTANPVPVWLVADVAKGLSAASPAHRAAAMLLSAHQKFEKNIEDLHQRGPRLGKKTHRFLVEGHMGVISLTLFFVEGINLDAVCVWYVLYGD